MRSKLSLRGLHSPAKVFTLVLACLPHAKATTEWAFSDGATVIPGADIDTSMSPDDQLVIAQSYKSVYMTTDIPSPFHT